MNTQGLQTGRRLVAVCLLDLVLCFEAWTQDYSVHGYSIDGGGGTSTGGVYSISGTNNPETLPASRPVKFYRLHKP